MYAVDCFLLGIKLLLRLLLQSRKFETSLNLTITRLAGGGIMNVIIDVLVHE